MLVGVGVYWCVLYVCCHVLVGRDVIVCWLCCVFCCVLSCVCVVCFARF